MFRFIKNKIAPSSRALQVSKNFSVPMADYTSTGERDAILASSGMGKSYLTGVLMEETIENGILLCVIDPEGEHFTLAERYPMVIVGGEHASIPLDEDFMDLYMEVMLKYGFSMVFDLSEYIDAEQQIIYAKIGDALFHAEQKYRRKVRLVVEEAQIYAPQKMSVTTGKDKGPDAVLVSQRIAKRGRKRALDSLWATQRPASISKDILSQCNRFWFGGITAEQDYKAIRPFLNEAGISFAQIKSLKPGEFFFYSKGKTTKIHVRKRFCKHAGATPEDGMHFQAASDKSLSAALKQLNDEMSKRTVEMESEKGEVARLKAAIRDLEEQNHKLRQDLEEERMATRVIERLGGSPPPTRRRSRKSDSGSSGDYDSSEVASGNKVVTSLLDDVFAPKTPERIQF